MAMIRPGERVTIESEDGAVVSGIVGDEIGSGGQGCVFQVTVSDERLGNVVVKWYNDYYAENFRAEQLEAIRELIEVGSPSKRFLWPLRLVSAQGNPSFGYLMDRIPPDYDELSRVVNDPASLPYDSLMLFGIQVARSLQELHTRGLAYRDINLKNFFVRVSSGDALICDTDNIGSEHHSYAGVLGMEEFMAPEIVRGDAFPSANTDRHSLAVMLFKLLVRWHPLEGQLTNGLMDDVANRKHFGTDPVFCFDPENESNRPPEDQPHAENYWNWYPQRVRDHFTRAFTNGLSDPQHGRVMESEWLETLVALRDAIATCPGCGGLTFVTSASTTCTRPDCGHSLGSVGLLTVRRGPGRLRSIVLGEGSRLVGYHIRSGFGDQVELGRVMSHPDAPGTWALHNTGEDPWTVRFADGETGVIDPGAGVSLEAGLRVTIGEAQVGVVLPD